MNLFQFVYTCIGSAAGLALIPPLWLHQRRNKEDLERFHQRLGWYPQALRSKFEGRPRVWLHAVSVGEVGVAAAIAKSLQEQRPGCRIVLSTATKQGLTRAKALFQNNAVCFYAPVDILGPSSKALKMVRPDVLGLLETEIWPNLIIGARGMGIRTAVLNGRISVRTIHRYLRIRPLIRHTLSHIDAFSMISTSDALRIQSLGADERRIAVHGNAKFDGPDPMAGGNPAKTWAQALYGLQPDTPVFVAGSTRSGEEPIVLDAYRTLLRDFPRTVLILAPRHVTRTDQVEQWVKDKGLSCQRRTELDGKANRRAAPVVLLDTIGELADTYSVADLVFCGGSLVPKGGQNVLEPAVWGKPVMYGPSMEDFIDAQQLIERAGGGRTVLNADQMAAVAAGWLRHPQKAKQAGLAARRAILSHRGAARKHAEVIVRLLN
ncbi:MAG: 3-deoxy-D-manno-octulosonic acid transferase [Desulfobacteraceae bacterium]|nr:MAG: 3-deoxy-D-manno-octulosonic acid transferase [Desulfobacteraceae bacterium]